jgi:hypothetical protein
MALEVARRTEPGSRSQKREYKAQSSGSSWRMQLADQQLRFGRHSRT